MKKIYKTCCLFWILPLYLMHTTQWKGYFAVHLMYIVRAHDENAVLLSYSGYFAFYMLLIHNKNAIIDIYSGYFTFICSLLTIKMLY